MKRLLLLSLFLISCGGQDASGISKESSRPIHPQSTENGAVTVTEYADLQCPACRGAHARIVAPLIEKYGSVIRYEFKHFPLRTIHRYAQDAGEAAECAADQGKFWPFIDLAYEKQDDLNEDALMTWASELDLDVDLFERCWKSRVKKKTVISDYEDGRKAGVGGTPTFFVDEINVPSSLEDISAVIDEKVGSMRQRL